MIVETQYLSRSKTLYVSYINTKGDLSSKIYPWDRPYKFVACPASDKDKDPVYKSWDGKHIKKEYNVRPDRYSTYHFLDTLPEEKTKEIFEFNLPQTYFIDIETEILPDIGFPDAKQAPAKILTLSVITDDKILLMGLKDLSDSAIHRIKNNTNNYFKKYNTDYKVKYVKYDCEFDMLYSFFHRLLPGMPCITGWNFLDFDLNYLINRARKITKTINGRSLTIDPAQSSPLKRIKEIWGTEYEAPSHKLCFDYMQLYESLDTSIKVKESSSLDFVSENILGLKKIEYDKSLTELYENDFEKYMLYNAVDSCLVQQIHQKMGYMSIIFAIASLARIKAVDVYNYRAKSLGSLAITEGLLRGRFRDSENIILFKDASRPRGQNVGLKGGWVKEPNVGMNSFVACYDFASLYPTTQGQFFIAPENHLGQVYKNDESKLITNNGEIMDISSDMVVTYNKNVFLKRMSPTLVMLRDVYASRKASKAKMFDFKKKMDLLIKEKQAIENKLN